MHQDLEIAWSVTLYLMLYAPLHMAGCFLSHLYGEASRMVRSSEGLLTESSGSWNA